MKVGGNHFSWSGNTQKIEEYRRAYRLTDKDNVSITLLPKGMAGKRAGSFVYTQPTLKGVFIKQELGSVRSRLRSLENSGPLTGKKQKEYDYLKAQQKALNSKLSQELAISPKCGFIVAEEDE